MTKAIRFNGAVGRCSSRVDGSMSLSVATPQLTTVEKAAIMDLQGINVDIIVTPLDINPSKTILLEVDKDLNTKTRSQRLRNV